MEGEEKNHKKFYVHNKNPQRFSGARQGWCREVRQESCRVAQHASCRALQHLRCRDKGSAPRCSPNDRPRLHTRMRGQRGGARRFGENTCRLLLRGLPPLLEADFVCAVGIRRLPGGVVFLDTLLVRAAAQMRLDDRGGPARQPELAVVAVEGRHLTVHRSHGWKKSETSSSLSGQCVSFAAGYDGVAYQLRQQDQDRGVGIDATVPAGGRGRSRARGGAGERAPQGPAGVARSRAGAAAAVQGGALAAAFADGAQDAPGRVRADEEPAVRRGRAQVHAGARARRRAQQVRAVPDDLARGAGVSHWPLRRVHQRAPVRARAAGRRHALSHRRPDTGQPSQKGHCPHQPGPLARGQGGHRARAQLQRPAPHSAEDARHRAADDQGAERRRLTLSIYSV